MFHESAIQHQCPMRTILLVLFVQMILLRVRASDFYRVIMPFIQIVSIHGLLTCLALALCGKDLYLWAKLQAKIILSRIDLHQENGEQEMKRANDEERLQEGEAEPMSDEHRNRQHRGLAAYLQGILDAQRLLGATVEERLTALRSIRERNRHQHGGSPEDAEERQGQLQCTVSTATPRWESFNRDAIAREA